MTDLKDKYYMRRALVLAVRAFGETEPNPVVGAVVVRDGKIVGKGWHEKAGGKHAEVIALEDAGSEAEGATIYVTLEPCNHHGKTGPCSELTVKKGIKRVVYSLGDPNEKARGGAEFLKESGIEVKNGVLKDETEQVLFSWLYYIAHGSFPKVAIASVGVEGKLINYKNRFLEKYFSKAEYLGFDSSDFASFDADFLLLVRTTLIGGENWVEKSMDLELVKAWKLANNSYSLYRIC